MTVDQRDAHVSQDFKPLLPSLRSLIYTVFLLIIGNAFIILLYRSWFGYALFSDVLLSLAVLYFRLRPVFELGFTPGRMKLDSVTRSDRRRGRLVFALEFLGAIIPLLLVYVLPFKYWVTLIYLLITCWPLANIEFYVVLRVIRRRFGVWFYYIQRYRSVLDEKYLIATGYAAVASPTDLHDQVLKQDG
jgi:hypothetical protein